MRFVARALPAALAALVLAVPAAQAFDPAAEIANYAKTLERSRVVLQPSYQLALRTATVEGVAAFAAILATDPARSPLTLCATRLDACAGDVRLYGWGRHKGEEVRTVRFTARTGALLSGHVWSYTPPSEDAAPRKRPGLVITPGSVQVTDEMYWWAAQTLARHGYEVLSFDIQSQGRSDTLGAGPDIFTNALPQSYPSFVENTEDALRFLRSTPSSPYTPVTTRTACGTPVGAASVAALQRTRAGAGRAEAYNPFHAVLQRDNIALAGHSYGTLGMGSIGQCDDSVRATVSWDYLRAGPGVVDGQKLPAPRVPGLGFSQDYGLPATPFFSDPDPEGKSTGFKRYLARGVDVMQINLRGAAHTDYSFLPDPAFGASLRGLDVVTWYTLAWLDRYLKHDKSALSRLLTDRWRNDRPGAAVDLRSDGNLFSFYYRSKMALTVRTRKPARKGRRGKLVAKKVTCDDLRKGCSALVARSKDGVSGDWYYLDEIGIPHG